MWKEGHFQRVCWSKKISSIKEAPEQSDKSFHLEIVSDNKEPWSVTLCLNHQSTNFCIDAGAKVTVISEKVYTKIGSPELKTSDKTLKGPRNDRLVCKGRFICYLIGGGQDSAQLVETHDDRKKKLECSIITMCNLLH